MAESGFEVQGLAKSCNEILLLAVLAGEAKHGYQLAVEVEERSDGFFRFNHGTLYPILHKLEKDGMIRGEWGEGGPARKRKSYKLTPAGRRYLDRQRRAWGRFLGHLTGIVGELKP
jgi:DNA-binding PadR family transcriptional regulator